MREQEWRLARSLTTLTRRGYRGRSAPIFNRTRRHVRRGRGFFHGREPVDQSNKSLPCRFAALKSLAISGKSEGDVLKGDLSPFKRAIARDKSEFVCD